MSDKERLFRPESDVGEHEFVSFSEHVNDFEKTAEVMEDLDFLKKKYDWGPVVGELFDYFSDRFGQVVDRNSVRLECCGEDGLTAKQYLEFPKIINDRIERRDLRIYRVLHHEQILMSKIIPNNTWVMLPDRKEKLDKALDGNKVDIDLLCMCEDLLNVKVRGEGLKSLLSKKEVLIFLKILSGEDFTGGTSSISNLKKKIIHQGWGDDFEIVLDGDTYKLSRIEAEID